MCGVALLGHAKELEKGMVYAQPDWDSMQYRVKSIKKFSKGVVVTHQDGGTLSLDNTHAVRFWEPGQEPKNV